LFPIQTGLEFAIAPSHNGNNLVAHRNIRPVQHDLFRLRVCVKFVGNKRPSG
jgi:hypothetical protein